MVNIPIVLAVGRRSLRKYVLMIALLILLCPHVAVSVIIHNPPLKNNGQTRQALISHELTIRVIEEPPFGGGCVDCKWVKPRIGIRP